MGAAVCEGWVFRDSFLRRVGIPPPVNLGQGSRSSPGCAIHALGWAPSAGPGEDFAASQDAAVLPPPPGAPLPSVEGTCLRPGGASQGTELSSRRQ